MRNKEKDEAAKAARRQRAMQVAFELFAAEGIDPVTMPRIAEASGVARPSLYRYFSTKVDLVIAIYTWKWDEYIGERDSARGPDGFAGMSAAEQLAWYLDSFVDLYRSHADVLRFNYFLNPYLQREGVTPEQRQAYLAVAAAIRASFHELYEKALQDGTLRRDLPEEFLFSSSFHIMLAAATRYAAGLVYLPDGGTEPEEELVFLRDALLRRYASPTTE